jgi:hypothetical protein
MTFARPTPAHVAVALAWTVGEEVREDGVAVLGLRLGLHGDLLGPDVDVDADDGGGAVEGVPVGQAGREQLGVGRAGSLGAAVGDRQRGGVGAVLQLPALLDQGAHVDDQGAEAQHGDQKQGHHHRGGAPLVPGGG